MSRTHFRIGLCVFAWVLNDEVQEKVDELPVNFIKKYQMEIINDRANIRTLMHE